MATVAEALAVAVQHHRSGRLAEAEGIYRQILAVEPDNADALHLLGVVAHQVGRYDLAVDLIGQAVASRPDFAAAHGNLGAALKELGRLDQAVASQRTAVALDPGFFEAYCNLAAVLTQLERADEALAAYGRAVALNPDGAELPTVAYNLGVVLERLGRLDEAVAVYAKAVALAPDLVPAHYNLGNALSAVGRLDDAVDSYERAIALDPRHAEAHTNLGNALQGLGRFTEAVAGYQTAIALSPGFAMAYNNLGNAWKKTGLAEPDRMEDAAAAYRAAIALRADYPEPRNGLGSVLCRQGRIGPALDQFDLALAHCPGFVEARVNRALALFLAGRLGEAWHEYQARWHGHPQYVGRPFPQPWWDGQSLSGKTLLIWGEQGLGDEIMGVGMLPDAIKTGAICHFECEPRLTTLLARSFPEVTFFPHRQVPNLAEHAADVQTPLFGMARFFRNRAADFPRYRTGYLVADPVKARYWQTWLDGLGPGLKVGFSWKARLAGPGLPPHFPRLDQWAELLTVPGAVFINLQYDEAAEDIATLRRDLGIDVISPPGLDLTGDIEGMAALVAGLDAVVGPATAAVVLAGALGRPGWMLAHHPVYCEMAVCNLDHVAWCPTIQAEKCGLGDDWRVAVARAAAGLRDMIGN